MLAENLSKDQMLVMLPFFRSEILLEIAVSGFDNVWEFFFYTRVLICVEACPKKSLAR